MTGLIILEWRRHTFGRRGVESHWSFSINSIAWIESTRLLGWRSGVVVSALASINEVNLRRARLVLRWATVSVPDIYFGM